MASAQVVETSVTNNSPSQDSNHPDDLFQSRYVTPGFKPFSYYYYYYYHDWGISLLFHLGGRSQPCTCRRSKCQATCWGGGREEQFHLCGNIRDQAGKDGVLEDSFQAVMQTAVVSHALGQFITMFSTVIIDHLVFNWISWLHDISKMIYSITIIITLHFKPQVKLRYSIVFRHIYHYYIHGPRGNDFQVGRARTASPFRNIDIQVGWNNFGVFVNQSKFYLWYFDSLVQFSCSPIQCWK